MEADRKQQRATQPAERVEMGRLRASGWTIQQIADHFHVCAKTVVWHLRGRRQPESEPPPFGRTRVWCTECGCWVYSPCYACHVKHLKNLGVLPPIDTSEPESDSVYYEMDEDAD